MDESTHQHDPDNADPEVQRVEVHRRNHGGGNNHGQSAYNGDGRTYRRPGVNIHFSRGNLSTTKLLWKLLPGLIIGILILALILTLFIWAIPYVLVAVLVAYVISLIGKLFKR